ncbi:MAG: hypothetical protein GY737_19565 [Desulfobacteraceae bacterium]|nr:hypothetical protein [Desulfobacteraceae bacterium]
MNSISPYSQALSGHGNPDRSLAETGCRSTQRRSLSASESSNVDLSLRTREGDVVTINAASFSELNTSSYDQRGKIVNGSSETMAHYSSRTMTLESGSSFTFSVQGDLSDQELDDIENIVGSLDEILAEMGDGDMDGAVETALGMTGYDTVSEFSADISMQRSYTMMSEISQESYSATPASGIAGESETLMDRMKQLIEDSEKEVQQISQQPVDQLFAHLLKPLEEKEQPENPKFQVLTDLRDRMREHFDQIMDNTSNLFSV